jgi:predicted transcriptional regulator
MKVGQVMTRPVLATTPNARIREIASHLVQAGISGVPVADRDGTIFGVVTEYDILNAVLEGKKLEHLTARDLMQVETISLDVGAELTEALKVFKERHILRVPVTQQGRLVGILSRGDALRVLMEDPEFLIF